MTAPELIRWADWEETKRLVRRQAQGRCYYCGQPADDYHHAFTPGHPLRLVCRQCHQLQHALLDAIRKAQGDAVLPQERRKNDILNDICHQ